MVMIRDMERGDIEAVMDLEREIFSTPWPPDVFRQEVRRKGRTIYIVAELDGRIVAYLGAGVMGHEVHIVNLAVDPGFRRAGIGSMLFIWCVRHGIEMGARWLVLEVRETNEPARSFYRLFGLHELGLRIGYYSDTGEHAIVLASGDICSPDYLGLLESIEEGILQKGAPGSC